MGKFTAIDDPSVHFQTTLYTGAGAGQTVTNGGNSDLKPDFLWIKRRNAGYAHFVVDSNRGLGSSNPPYLETDSAAAENSNQNWISGVGTDSFTIGINEQNLSNTSGTYVAWQWKANGGTTATNSDGNITSTVQANQDAGFSIVTWTGNESASATVGHGLGVTPKVVMIKSRSGAYSWNVYLGALPQTSGNNMFCFLDTTSAAFQVAGTAFNSSTFQPSGNVKRNGGSMLAYCFAEKQGYSKFGSYVGNGNGANGPFVYTGFKPAFVMIKVTSAAEGWVMFDNKRKDFNQDAAVNSLYANTSQAEYTGASYHNVDLLSNGFKVLLTNVAINQSGASYIYMAFAESSFVSSLGIPTTAR